MNDFSIEIRAAELRDSPAMSELLSELGFPSSAAVVSERLEALSGAGETALVAVRGGEVVGLLTLHITPVLHRPTPVGRLTALVVTVRERGKGVGRLLVDAAEQFFAARGCELVEVTSNLRLADAHSFYRSLGYEATSVRFKKSISRANPSSPL
jgi:GNAT superfamily N-acetyltransferase